MTHEQKTTHPKAKSRSLRLSDSENGRKSKGSTSSSSKTITKTYQQAEVSKNPQKAKGRNVKRWVFYDTEQMMSIILMIKEFGHEA